MIACKVVPPSRLRPEVPPALEAICLNCLRRRPGDRYRSAAEVAAELARFLRDEQPVRPAPPRWEWPDWVRPWQAALVALAALLGTAALAMGPAGRPSDPLRQLEGELQQDRPVKLIGKGQPLRWSRRIVGLRSATPVDSENGSLTIVASGLCLVELAPDPKRDRFLFRAEIKHIRSSDKHAKVGLYVAHKSVMNGRPTPAHLFTQITFDDTTDSIKSHDDAVKNNPRIRRQRPRGNAVTTKPCIAAGPEWTEGHSVGAPGTSAQCFRGHGGENGPWRTLEVEVTPDGVRCFWIEKGKRIPAGTLSAAEHLENMKMAFRAVHPNSRAFGIQPEYVPGGGIGLYIERSTAAFRNVVISPLRK